MIVTAEEGSRVLEAIENERRENKMLAKEAVHYIINFDGELQNYKDRKIDFLETKTSDLNSGIRGGMPGRPTEGKVIRAAMFDENYEPLKWLKTIEILKGVLGERKNIFLRVRVEAAKKAKKKAKGRPSWIGYVQYRYSEELSKRFFVNEVYSDETIKKWWNEIIQKAVELYKKI